MSEVIDTSEAQVPPEESYQEPKVVSATTRKRRRLASVRPEPEPEPQLTVPCCNCGKPSTRCLSYREGPTLDLCPDDNCHKEAYARWESEQAEQQVVKEQVQRLAAPAMPDEVFKPGYEGYLPTPHAPDLPALPMGPYGTALELSLPEDLEWNEWIEVGKRINIIARASLWWLGDYLRFGERKFGQEFAQIVDELGYAVQTAKNAMAVCGAIPPEDRHPEMSYSHHAEVAFLQRDERRRWLELAAQKGWSVSEMRHEIQVAKMAGVPGSRVGKPPSNREIKKTVLTFGQRLHQTVDVMAEVLPKAQEMVALVESEQFDEAAFQTTYHELLKLRDDLTDMLIDANRVAKAVE